MRGGQIAEQFILWPDQTEGRFDRYKNRTLFYGREDKINQRLPALVRAFGERRRATLTAIYIVLAGAEGARTIVDSPR